MIKKLTNRSSIPKKYQWDLEMLLGSKSVEQSMEKVFKEYKKLIDIKDKKYKNKKTYLNALKMEDEFAILSNKVTNYLSNKLNENVVDPKYLQLKEKFEYELHLLSQQMGSESNRFFDNYKKIKRWSKKPEFSQYKHHLIADLEWKDHKLSKEISEFIIKAKRGDVDASQIFSILSMGEIENDYGVIETSKGKKIKYNESLRNLLSKSPDPKVRKESALKARDAFLKNKSTLSNILYQHFKAISTEAKLLNFSDSIEFLTFDDRVNKKFLNSLYSSVQENKDIFKKYIDYHRKFYQKKFNKKMTEFDGNVDLIKVKTNYTIEEAQKIVIEALKPFGKEYSEVVKRALLKERWVDYMPSNSKYTGAYSIGASYGLDKKYILMNFEGTLRSVETLAHEMGHSMHSYFSDTYNDVRNSKYPIFLAEIASIFNELMLSDYLLKTNKDIKMQFYLRGQIINNFIATVFRQVEWSNYEFDVYNAIDKGEPVSSYESLTDIYYQNSLKYKIKTPKSKEKDHSLYWSIRVPHFYYGFYVYKYAIGQLCALIFFQKYKLEGPSALQNYIDKFLKMGSRNWPLEILKEAGIDLYDPETYKLGFDFIDDQIKEWIEEGKQIFKVK